MLVFALVIAAAARGIATDVESFQALDEDWAILVAGRPLRLSPAASAAVEAAANPDVAQWLCCNRWEASSVDVRDVMHRYHRDTDGDVLIPPYVFVEARLL